MYGNIQVLHQHIFQFLEPAPFSILSAYSDTPQKTKQKQNRKNRKKRIEIE